MVIQSNLINGVQVFEDRRVGTKTGSEVRLGFEYRTHQTPHLSILLLFFCLSRLLSSLRYFTGTLDVASPKSMH